MNIIAKLLKFLCCAALIAIGIPVGLLILEKSVSINQPPQKGDVIVVLGCPTSDNGSPSPMLRSRVEKGVELWKAGYAAQIILTGNAVSNRWNEAESMEQLAKSLGIPESAIILESAARDTIENARFTNEIMQTHGWHSVLLVTSPFHTRRAQKKFVHYGLNVTTIVAPYPPDMQHKDRISLLMKELF